jgi:hypothetical protein
MNTVAGISDFNDADRWVAESALKERYGEIRPDPASAEVTTCPLYREVRGVEFVIFKIAKDRFRSQFYYSATEQYGTGRDFDDLAGTTSGKTGAELGNA